MTNALNVAIEYFKLKKVIKSVILRNQVRVRYKKGEVIISMAARSMVSFSINIFLNIKGTVLHCIKQNRVPNSFCGTLPMCYKTVIANKELVKIFSEVFVFFPSAVG